MGDARPRRRGAGDDGGADGRDGDAGIAECSGCRHELRRSLRPVDRGRRRRRRLEAGLVLLRQRHRGRSRRCRVPPAARRCALVGLPLLGRRGHARARRRGRVPRAVSPRLRREAETGGRSLPGRGNAWNSARPRAPDRRCERRARGRARGAGREPARSDGRRRNAHCRAPRAGRHGWVARPLPGQLRGRQAPAQGSRAGAAPLRGAAE